MYKAVLALTVFFSAPLAQAQITCMGFLPETTVLCDGNGVLNKVHGEEEARCGAGRDGQLNDTIQIYKVDGPTWREPGDGAEITFLMESGESVTLTHCQEIEI
jgi:hypothetical protein